MKLHVILSILLVSTGAFAGSITLTGAQNGLGISENGQVLVGSSYDRAYRHDTQGTSGSLSFESPAAANGVSGDGSMAVGYARLANYNRAVRWVNGSPVQILPSSISSGSFAWDISIDGSTIVGRSQNSWPSTSEAFRWVNGTTTQLGFLPSGSFSEAWGVSRDGGVVVGTGNSVNAPIGGREAFRWTESDGMVGLGFVPGGTSSIAYGVSPDGGVVVGTAGVSGGSEAFRWTEASGMVSLGDFAGGSLSARGEAASENGEVVVGVGVGPSGTDAFVWTEDLGMQSLKNVLQNAGVDLTGWSYLRSANDISSDGRFVSGYGTYLGNSRGFIVDLQGTAIPEPSTWVLMGILMVTVVACAGHRIRP